MNILFLDLSTKSTGWCLASQDGEMLKYGCIPIAGTNTVGRIRAMQQAVKKIIQDNDVGKLVAEDVHPDKYGSHSHTERMLMWLQGSILIAANEVNPKNDYTFIEYMQSSSWRSVLGIKTGRGVKRDSLKQADIDFVKSTYGISANDDVCDAICLYTAYFLGKNK